MFWKFILFWIYRGFYENFTILESKFVLENPQINYILLQQNNLSLNINFEILFDQFKTKIILLFKSF
jgi:hypothetical protein